MDSTNTERHLRDEIARALREQGEYRGLPGANAATLARAALSRQARAQARLIAFLDAKIRILQAEIRDDDSEPDLLRASVPGIASSDPRRLDPATYLLVEAVKAHATAHYNDGGWDVLVECWDDEALATAIREDSATTPEAAIAVFLPLVGIWADRQADARNSAF